MAVMEKQECVIAPLQQVGLNIQAARKQRKMSVDKLSELTRVSVRYIHHIEAGRFDNIPGRTYVLGFTRAICLVLDLDSDEVLATLKAVMYPAKINEMTDEGRFEIAPRQTFAERFRKCLLLQSWSKTLEAEI